MVLEDIAPPRSVFERSHSWTKAVLSLARIASVSSFFLEAQGLKRATLGLTATLLLGLVGVWAYSRATTYTAKGLARRMHVALAKDPQKKILVSYAGKVFFRNDAARDDGLIAANLVKDLGVFIVDAQETLTRLHEVARLKERATETLVTRKGMTDLTVTCVEKNFFLSEITGRAVTPPSEADEHAVPMIMVGLNTKRFVKIFNDFGVTLHFPVS